jgi:acyl-CoA oxidase
VRAAPTRRNEEYIAPAKAKAIQRLIVDLCSELRGVAVPLVGAFNIPDHILRAPIGEGEWGRLECC